MPSTLARLTLPLAAAGMLCCGATPLHAAPTAGTPPGAQQQQGGERWTINLKDADIRAFIDQIADITGETFIVDPRVKGQVTVLSRSPLGLSEVYQLFLSVMATHGYTVVTENDQARIVPNAEAKAEAGVGGASDSLETRVLPVQNTPVTDLIPLIRPLVPQYGHLAAVTSANALIISDRSANITRIEGILKQLDNQQSHDYSVVNLQYAWVMDAADALTATLNRGQSKGGATAQVIADARTNRLIIIGPAEARAKLVGLAQSLDTPTSRSANTRVIRLRHSDAKSMAETLGEITKSLQANSENAAANTQGQNGGRPQTMLVRADESLNAIVLMAEPDTVAMLEDIVHQLDVPRAQVMVEAAIVEISGDISDALGVQWYAKKGSAVGGTNFSGTGLSIGTVLQAIQDDEIPDNLPDGAIIGLGSSSFGALITALSANSKSNLLSTPSLLTLDNQKAEILVGQNVPFQTGSYTTSVDGASNPFTTIERQDIGVTLKVTPHINEGSTLRLELEQEISSIAPSTTTTANAVDLITNKRSIKSTVLADDGQVIVLGGLIQDDVTRTDSKVPLLGDIPFLGRLFRYSSDSHTKRNLMVFLRPTIVRDAAGLASISGKKYSDIRVIGDQGDGARPSILPREPRQLFDGQGAPAVDLRNPPQR